MKTAVSRRVRPPLEVWKFGGASLADAAAIHKAVSFITSHDGPIVVVASALAGVTDLLLDGARSAAAGQRDAAGRIAATFLKRHRDVARALVPAGAARRRLFATIDAAAREYHELCGAVAVLGHIEAARATCWCRAASGCPRPSSPPRCRAAGGARRTWTRPTS